MHHGGKVSAAANDLNTLVTGAQLAVVVSGSFVAVSYRCGNRAAAPVVRSGHDCLPIEDYRQRSRAYWLSRPARRIPAKDYVGRAKKRI
jgi:hypothetical protein